MSIKMLVILLAKSSLYPRKPGESPSFPSKMSRGSLTCKMINLIHLASIKSEQKKRKKIKANPFSQ